jgi:hypothetical protein
LTEQPTDPDVQENTQDDFRARLDRLETGSQELLRQSERRVVLAELKVEAMRAGMIDMDGLMFLDMKAVQMDDDGSVSGGSELITQLKRSKPWLFTSSSSSSLAKVPQSRPTRQKLATEMTDEEYRTARTDILRRSML